jgi:diguanylate cyclase (GGDEF)-like protein/PAS domain S-box-containing protein
MARTPCVLIVDDSEDDAELLVWELRRHAYEPVWEIVDDAAAMRAALASRRWDIILCDYHIPGFGGLEALQVLKESGQDVPLVIVSGALGEETAVEAMKAGAADFVLKDRLGRLGPILKRELGEVAVRRRLMRTQIQWTAAFDSVSDAIFIHDGAGRILRVNRAYEELAQAPAAALLGKPYWEVFPKSDGPLQGCARAAGDPGVHNEEEVALATGQVFLSRHFPVTDERGQTIYFLHVMQDITERKSSERRIARLKRLYETRSQTSRLIVGASDEQALFSAICGIAVEQGGMVGAVVRVADEEALVLRPVAYSESARLMAEQARIGIDPAQVLLPAATAYLENRVFTHNDLAAEPGQFVIPVGAGIRSMAVLPLRRGGRPMGVLTLFAGEPHYIDEEMVRLLEEMATDISFALDNFDREREQQLAQRALQESEAKFRGLVEQRLAGISIVEDGCYSYVNARFAEMFGYAPGELVGQPEMITVAEEDQARVSDSVRLRLSRDQRTLQYTFTGKRKNASRIAVEAHGAVTTVSGRKVIVSLLQDISERVRAELHTMRLARARRVMAECNRILVHEVDEARMLDEMCRVVVELGGYVMAWVGMVRHDTDCTIEPVARAGDDAGYLDAVRVSWADNEYGRGPAGLAVRTGQPQATRHVATDPLFTRWREEALARGFLAAAALPLIHGGEVLGVVAMFTGEPEGFDTDEVALLQELTGDIAFGIGALRGRGERERALGALRQAEELFRQLAGNIPQAFWVREAESNTMLYVSPGWEIITGRPAPSDWPGVLRVLHQEDHERVAMDARQFDYDGENRERRIVRPDGSTRWLHVRSFPIRNDGGAVYRVAGMAEDITERKASEQRLLEMAHYDTLTSLPNRKLFFDSLYRTLQQAEQNQWTVAVMFIDLDRFKVVNDTLGHATGDALLQQVASRLLGCVRIRDIVGRLGGDEFAMILPALDHTEDAALIAGKIVEAFSEPFELDGREVFITASLGITIFPFDARDAATLMRYADTAMYRAKEEGRNVYRYFTTAMNERALEKMELENQLRRARERGEFLLHYQPKVELRTGRICGVEALLRWRRPGGELPPPMDYIPLLEETGLIVAVGEWVINEACRQVRAWEQLGVPVPVAVNLSARQFHDKQLATVIARAVAQAGIRAELLECEITESSLMLDAAETIRILRALRAAGSTLSIDDFGTGYSSLGYLKRFPIHAVKIDRSFVSDIITSAEDAALAKGIISMAHSLNLKVIAEGVETAEQCEFLRSNGCDQGQGYFFSEPADAEEITRQLRARPAAQRRKSARSAKTAPADAAPRRGRTASRARRAAE